jgi:hypothetical protein
MAQREKKGYALKKARGLVPHPYDRNSRSFQQGAEKNWPSRWDHMERATAARKETASRDWSGRWHRFAPA